MVADAVADAAVGKEGARVRLRVRVGMVARILRLLDPVTRVRLQAKVRAERERLRRKLHQRRGRPRPKRQPMRAIVMW